MATCVSEHPFLTWYAAVCSLVAKQLGWHELVTMCSRVNLAGTAGSKSAFFAVPCNPTDGSWRLGVLWGTVSACVLSIYFQHTRGGRVSWQMVIKSCCWQLAGKQPCRLVLPARQCNPAISTFLDWTTPNSPGLTTLIMIHPPLYVPWWCLLVL